MIGSCTYLGYRGKKLELLAFTLQHEWMNMISLLPFVCHKGMPHVRCYLPVRRHTTFGIKTEKRALTATPVFILTKYLFSIFVYTSQRIVPLTGYGWEWPSGDGRTGRCISLVLRIRTFYPLRMRTYARKPSGSDSPLTYRHISEERNPRHHFFVQ
jgi:hypothetical protein